MYKLFLELKPGHTENMFADETMHLGRIKKITDCSREQILATMEAHGGTGGLTLISLLRPDIILTPEIITFFTDPYISRMITTRHETRRLIRLPKAYFS